MSRIVLVALVSLLLSGGLLAEDDAVHDCAQTRECLAREQALENVS